jgi:hypothetical protein
MDIEKYLATQHGNQSAEFLSVENFKDTVGDFWRDLKHGKKEKLTYGTELKNALKRTYLNPSWLGHRRFVGGSVSVVGGSLLEGQWEAKARGILAHAQAGAKKDEALVLNALKSIEPALKLFASGDWKSEDKVIAFLNKWGDYEDRLESMTNPKWSPPVEVIEKPETIKLPALDQRGVVHTAEFIVELFEGNYMSHPFGEAWKHKLAPVGGVELYGDDNPVLQAVYDLHDRNSKLSSWLRDVLEAVSEYAYSIENSYYHNSEAWQHYYVSLTNYQEAMSRWIDLSVR